MRRVRLAGTVLVTAGLLAGCSPAQLDLIAVYNGDDGRPWVMLAPCGKDTITSVEFQSRPKGNPIGPTDEPSWKSRRFTPGIGGGSFPLFSPPASWNAVVKGEQQVLPDFRYSVSFYSPDDGAYYGNGFFAAEDLAGLKPGEVWAAGEAMTRQEFRDHRSDTC